MPRPTPAGMAAAGRAVRAWRAEETQQAVADRAGINIDTLGDLEAGSKWPRNRTLRAVERALGHQPGALDRIAAEVDAADRSPPSERLREETRNAIRRDVGDPVLAEQVIAYTEGLASGRIAPAAPGADPREDGQARQRRQG